MQALSCEHLELGYENTILVRDLNFSVEQGDYLCIVGENGSGKTTLMKTILHLQPPKSGKIILGEGIKPTEIGYLPQQTEVQRDFPASVREIVLSGFQGKAGLRPFYTKEEKKKAAEEMERLQILELSDHSYRDLSGGQQQRVLLARALCATERILLLDEPVAGLDPKVTQEMYEIIKKLNQNKITIIMISHDIHMAVQDATHILHIGEELFFGTTEAYRSSPLGKRYLSLLTDPK